MDIKKQLEELGLGGKKAEVYLAVLQLGKATVIQISQKARIKRPTTYDILEDLIAKNLISQTFENKKRFFIAEKPENLKLMIKKQETKVDNILPELNSLFNLIPHKPKIRYYEGLEGIVQVFEELLTTKDKNHYYFGSVKNQQEVLGTNYINDWIKRKIKARINTHAIRVKSKEIDIKGWGAGKEFLREVKYLPIDIKEDISTITIFDDKVAIISALGESYGLIIESTELSTLLRYIWQVAWQASKSK